MAKPYRKLPQLSNQEIERFWSKVNVAEPDECWLWYARGCGAKGYGNFKMGRKTYTASRVAYFIATNQDPGSLFVLHRCDAPACVNPSHLFLGTLIDNSKDMVAKGRAAKGKNNGVHLYPESVPRGETHHLAKFSDTVIDAIRQAIKQGWPCSQIMSHFKISKSHVYRIIHQTTRLKLPMH
jgi:hypothetical protein